MSAKDEKTREPQYQPSVELRNARGFSRLGITTNWVWDEDPRRLTFVFSRYKFVSRMLEGSGEVLEIGCADAFASRIVRRYVTALTCAEFDPVFVADARETDDPQHSIKIVEHDILSGPVAHDFFDAAYSVDVMEHIAPDVEDIFLSNICKSLKKNGIFIAGMPSLESQKFTSEANAKAHVNCKTGPALKETMSRYFANVFIFSMNDEVVHTGYTGMAHYLFALCCGPLARK